MRILPKELLEFANEVGHEFIFFYISPTLTFETYKCKNCGIKCLVGRKFYGGWELSNNKDTSMYLEGFSCKELQIKSILE
jgi:hypothetical protein